MSASCGYITKINYSCVCDWSTSGKAFNKHIGPFLNRYVTGTFSYITLYTSYMFQWKEDVYENITGYLKNHCTKHSLVCTPSDAFPYWFQIRQNISLFFSFLKNMRKLTINMLTAFNTYILHGECFDIRSDKINSIIQRACISHFSIPHINHCVKTYKILSHLKGFTQSFPKPASTELHKN